jgi:hypothetical protein
MTDSDLIEKLQEWRQEDTTEMDPQLRRMKESYRFYTGIQQWDQADIDQLDDEGRPHLTINLTFPIINTLIGHQIGNQQEPRLFPRRGGSKAVAALGTELLKHTLDISDDEFHSMDVFLDGIVGSMGVFAIERRRDRDKINGELLIRKKSPFAVTFDQNAIEYDFNESGRRVNEEKWMTTEQIELGFGADPKELKQATADPQFQNETLSLDDDYAETRKIPRERRDQYLVNRCFWRKWKKNVYLVDLSNWHTKLLDGKDMIETAKNAVEYNKKQAKEVGINPRMMIIERAGWMLYETWYAGAKLLKHKENPWFGIMDFPLIPFYPYWADGYALGAVDNLKDMQRELNKRVSQELHILNTTANSGHIIGDDADTKAVNDLKKHGSKSGYVVVKSKLGDYYEKIVANKLPQGHFMMAKQHEGYMDKASGVDPNMRGVTERKESGTALQTRMDAGLNVARVVFKNFNRTQMAKGRFLWDAIRQKDAFGQNITYSDPEIESIVQESNLKDFIGPDGSVDLTPFYEDMGSYGLKVTTSPASPTVRMQNLDILLRIAEKYPPGPDGRPVIPPEFLLELTDLPQSEELIERLQRMSAVPAVGVA